MRAVDVATKLAKSREMVKVLILTNIFNNILHWMTKPTVRKTNFG